MDKPIEEQIQQLVTESRLQVIVSQEAVEEDEISLGELFKVLFDGRKMIIFITLIAFVCGSLFASVNSFLLNDEVGKVESMISFHFDGIENGKDPEGKAFDITELFSKEILEETLAQQGIVMSSEKLRQNLEIQGIVPASVQQQMMLIQQMAEKDITQLEKVQEIEYFPTQYKITLHITKELGLEGDKAERLLRSLIENYTVFFVEEYGDRKLLSTAITTIDPLRYEYSEYMLMVDNTLSELETFLRQNIALAGGYRSKTTGLSLQEIMTQVGMLRDIEVNNTEAIIGGFILTKDKERLISIYQNNIDNLAIQLEEKNNLSHAIGETVASYEKNQLVVMAQETGVGNIEVSTGSKTYDDLISQTIEIENEAHQIEYNMSYYQNLLNELQAEVIVPIDVTPYIQQVEEDLIEIQEQLTQLILVANDTVEEFYSTELLKSSISRDMPPMYESYTMDTLKSNVLVIVIVTLLGGILAVLYVLVKGMAKENQQQVVQGGSHEV